VLITFDARMEEDEMNAAFLKLREAIHATCQATTPAGWQCQLLAQPGKELCATHDPERKRQRATPPIPDEAELALQVRKDLRRTAGGWFLSDRRTLKSEQARLQTALREKAPLHPEDYMLAAVVLPSTDPATQARREAGLPGPNDGVGDAERVRTLIAVFTRLLNATSKDREARSAVPAPSSKLGYTLPEAAERLGCHESWLQRQVQRRAIPHRRMGKRVVLTDDDLSAILRGAAEVPLTGVATRRPAPH
jgi:excisionase family DNA binding protein